MLSYSLFLLPLCLLRSEDSNKRPPGTPGTPGSRDLEAALRRLSLRRDNYLSEKRFFEEERERKLAYPSKEEEKESGEGSGGPGTPTESLLSLCSHPSFGSILSGYSITARSYLPEKLQIVKPLEGDYCFQSSMSANPHETRKEKEILKRKHQKKRALNQNFSYLFQSTPKGDIQFCPADQQQNQNLIFQTNQPSTIFLRASVGGNKLQRSSSLSELSSLPPSFRAPLALSRGLLKMLEQQEVGLNPQHSFYFQHTQPHCWVEV